MACVALYSVFIGSQYLLVVILLIGILAFLGTAVFSKFIDKGKVIERDSKIIISLAIIFIILGALISAITAIGIIRLKDVYSRGHAAGKSATLGAIFYYLERFIFYGNRRIRQYATDIRHYFHFDYWPSSHLMMKASYNNKTPYTKDTKIDELKDEFNNKKI